MRMKLWTLLINFPTVSCFLSSSNIAWLLEILNASLMSCCVIATEVTVRNATEFTNLIPGDITSYSRWFLLHAFELFSFSVLKAHYLIPSSVFSRLEFFGDFSRGTGKGKLTVSFIG